MSLGDALVEPVHGHGAVRVLFRFLHGSYRGRAPLVIGGLAPAFRVTLGVGPSRPCSPWPLPWPAGQERFGQLLSIRATKPDKNPPSTAAPLIRTTRPG